MSDAETKDRRNTLYETDFYVWTQEQARLLSERRFDDLDLENLVDEVQSVGWSEEREIRSGLVVLIAHLLKWKFQPGGRGSSWIETIFEQRQQIADIVASSPSLRKYQEDQISRAYRAARLAATKETGIALGNSNLVCEETAGAERFEDSGKPSQRSFRRAQACKAMCSTCSLHRRDGGCE